VNPELLNSYMNVDFFFMLESDITQVTFVWPFVFNVFIIYSLSKNNSDY